ncbi:MAG: 1-deoxy-D-xylulose-5-phosphate synthase [Planctomycetes bacterium]|nr:1-deoxy-D-xylulose-5-phosphate synthase [Planctomycetota bacterium]
MTKLLPNLAGPQDLQKLTDNELTQLAQEIRDELVRVLSIRPAHFASNLGVVELCIALHLTFDFSKDRLIWDTGHQIYPHKLITGRFKDFGSIRTKGGLMGYPNPHESDYDLFMTGHAGCAASTTLGLKLGDEMMGRPERHSVAVVGDGAFPSGIVFEALNNSGHLKRKHLVILNDNQMSICPRVGALANTLDRARLTNFYQDSKKQVRSLLSQLPLLGNMATHAFDQVRDAAKALLTGGMLFEELGFHYVGPIDGHDLSSLRHWLNHVKDHPGPVLLHVITVKGKGVPQASDDPVTYHTPPVFEKVGPDHTIVSLKKGGAKAYTDAVSTTIHELMNCDPRVSVITAAMCQGNKLEKIRTDYPTRFFDVAICESHAVAFAAGIAKAGARPICNIYSTFLQRGFDQIFQEVALQNLPVVFTLDRSGLTGPDGPTHHGCFDIAYMRLFPNMVVMAPGDELDVAPMLHFAVNQTASPISLRYPKAGLERIERTATPIELGQAEVLEWGTDAVILAFGTLLSTCAKAAEKLRAEGLEIGVVNARFAKPLDRATVLKAIEEANVVVTVEEGTLEGGFGSAVLECANAAGADTRNIIRLGIPDRFVEHGERPELFADLGLDADGIANTIRQALEKRAIAFDRKAFAAQ